MGSVSRAQAPAVPVPAAATGDGGPSLYGVVDVLRPDRIAGWVIDRRDRSSTLDVEVRREGRVVATVKAARPRRDLERAGVGTGNYGFTCDLDPPLEAGLEFTVTATARAADGTNEDLRHPSAAATPDPERRLLQRIFEDVGRLAAQPAASMAPELSEMVQRLELTQARLESAIASLEGPPALPSQTGLKILLAVAVTMAGASLAIGLASMMLP
jgi:hypothetical protein